MNVFPLQLTNDEEKEAFIDDYRMTACISILQWFCMEYKKLGEGGKITNPDFTTFWNFDDQFLECSSAFGILIRFWNLSVFGILIRF